MPKKMTYDERKAQCRELVLEYLMGRAKDGDFMAYLQEIKGVLPVRTAQAFLEPVVSALEKEGTRYFDRWPPKPEVRFDIKDAKLCAPTD